MSQSPMTDIGNELVEKIRREFPEINADQAHRIVRIFAEHMRETIKKVNNKLEQDQKRLGTLGSLMGPRY